MDLWKQGGSVALATLVGVEGSSYRRTGARLLIGAAGTYAGSISGGCLEAEVIRKASWKVRNGAVVERYSTLFDDTADIPYGLGCGGTVDVLLEPAETPEFDALMIALADTLAGGSRTVRTSLPREGRALHRVVESLPSGMTGEDLRRGARASALEGQSDVVEELLLPPQRLLLCGAGDDARPLASMASLLGWDVAVVDGRAQWARSERFPEAERVEVVAEPVRFKVRAGDAVVVMTHSYEQDREWLTALLPRGVRYLGLLGARHRSALLVSEAAAILHWPIERVCSQIWAPVGLDLGGDGAEAIALAIMAEMLACVEGKLGVSQRMTPELVREQVTQGGASRYLQAQCAL